MIEFLLLFTLGFLAAALVALIIAPVIHRRVVTLTERRIRMSVPLSTNEIRAEKDMARAAFAAENARLSVDLTSEREKLSERSAHVARLGDTLVALRAGKDALAQELAEEQHTTGQLRSDLQTREAAAEALNAQVNAAGRLGAARDREIATLRDRISRLEADTAEMKIDVATGDTEAENLKAQIQALRDERKALRTSLRDAETATRETAIRLKTEEGRAGQLDDRLGKAIATLSDREQTLERNQAEIERLKEKQKQLFADTRDTTKALKVAAAARQTLENRLARADRDLARPAAGPKPAQTSQGARLPEPGQPIQPEPVVLARAPGKSEPSPPQWSIEERVERLRARQAALVERLLKAATSAHDAALRREISEVAALMIELTAEREGKASSIRKILAGREAGIGPSEPSLAGRARRHLGLTSA